MAERWCRRRSCMLAGLVGWCGDAESKDSGGRGLACTCSTRLALGEPFALSSCDAPLPETSCAAACRSEAWKQRAHCPRRRPWCHIACRSAPDSAWRDRFDSMVDGSECLTERRMKLVLLLLNAPLARHGCQVRGDTSPLGSAHNVRPPRSLSNTSLPSHSSCAPLQTLSRRLDVSCPDIPPTSASIRCDPVSRCPLLS